MFDCHFLTVFWQTDVTFMLKDNNICPKAKNYLTYKAQGISLTLTYKHIQIAQMVDASIVSFV